MCPSNYRFEHVLARLESPFLDEELRSLEVTPRINHVGEVEFEKPSIAPSTVVSFLGGILWSFTAKTLPMRVSVFCPSALNPLKPIDMLVYAHGDLDGCKPYPKTADDLITKTPFELGKIVDASLRGIALVVPHMDWPNLTKNKLNFEACNHKTYKMHALGVPTNLNGVLKEVLAEIARASGTSITSVKNLILAGHSRAHAFFNPLALLHVDAQMSKGVLASLTEVWCLDSTYVAYMAEWIRWLRSNVNLRVSVFYCPGTDTAVYGRKFADAAPTVGGGKLIVTSAKEGHCRVPIQRLPHLLKASAPSVTPEITEEWWDEAAEQEFDDLGSEVRDEEEFVGVDNEQDEDDLPREWFLEERFDPASLPANVAAARDKKDWPLTLKLAIEAGIRSETDLTNIVFFALHPELPHEPLKKEDPNFKKLSAEWKRILMKEVKPAIAKAAENTSLKVSAKFVLERDAMFAGETGKKFKALVEEAAREADINPGLLAAVLLAEFDQRSLYLSPGEVVSFDSGTDDFFAMQAQLKANVPAFAKVRFNPATKTTDINEHGRKVTTVAFKTGKDAALATAVYLKYAEIKLRRAAAKNSGDFDTFPVETRFALVRVAMAAGHGGITPDGDFIWFKKKGGKWTVAKKGERGARLRGVASRLESVLKGGDFLVRKHEPRRNPTHSAHITNRNATILAAQALHLSEWIFGIPLNAGVQPELEWLGNEDEETSDLMAESF